MTGWSVVIAALGLGGAVIGAVVGVLAAPWLASLVPATSPARRGSQRWFLRRVVAAAVGALVGMLAALHVLATGEIALWPAALILLGAAAGACLVDAAGHRLPDVLVLRGWALGAVAALAATPWAGSRVLVALGVSVVACGVLGGLLLLAPRSIGLGDVKLVGLLGLLTGLIGVAAAASALLAAVLLGGVAALALLATRRATRSTALAFGPWLLAGAGCAIVGAALTAARALPGP